MKIGILREEKSPPDRRVIFTPDQCKWIIDNSNFDIYVQSSNTRCFSDNLYSQNGIQIVDDLSHCDILLGIKEVPERVTITLQNIFLFFSYNKETVL